MAKTVVNQSMIIGVVLHPVISYTLSLVSTVLICAYIWRRKTMDVILSNDIRSIRFMSLEYYRIVPLFRFISLSKPLISIYRPFGVWNFSTCNWHLSWKHCSVWVRWFHSALHFDLFFKSLSVEYICTIKFEPHFNI